ncbi:MAG: ribonuclease H-like domain-containing protein [Candidatus Bipolaricaulis sp.]|nr:ribonuclease H-like domain-containing protein [Candidatus Bipolaricaulis sp.]MDD5219179.1 ribonuclease H-like domain-containing protein [Candidatus Bipolaricaulis sp.]MDD5646665.1 ribonuclease H-like domain-containing protein [Candidatus Bipolaricaulis sp.]
MRSDRLAGWLAGRAAAEDPINESRYLLGAFDEPAEEVLRSGVRDRAFPDVLTFEFEEPFRLDFPPTERVRASVERMLHLLYGIGSCRSAELRRQGYETLDDLASHPQWGDRARALLAEWGPTWDVEAIFRTLGTWLPTTDPLLLDALGLVPRGRVLFFDLETLGLSNTPIFLIAIARLGEQTLLVRQFLATSLAGERSLLARFRRELEDTTALVSYNGKAFDWTLLRERFAYYSQDLPGVRIHADLLHHVRRRFGDALPDAHLGTVEERLLEVRRTDDLPSALVPQFYSRYLETGSPAPLRPILDHNRQDIRSLAQLLRALLSARPNAS